MKHLKLLFTVFCLLILSCDYSPWNHYDINFQNNSDSVIYIQFNVENNPLYYNEYHIDEYCIKIDSKQTKVVNSGSMLGWEEFIASLPDKTVSFFISDTILYECDSSNVELHILQQYDLTEKDLNCLDWTVSYPPDERMKDMKMYPPYGNWTEQDANYRSMRYFNNKITPVLYNNFLTEPDFAGNFQSYYYRLMLGYLMPIEIFIDLLWR